MGILITEQVNSVSKLTTGAVAVVVVVVVGAGAGGEACFFWAESAMVIICALTVPRGAGLF